MANRSLRDKSRIDYRVLHTGKPVVVDNMGSKSDISRSSSLENNARGREYGDTDQAFKELVSNLEELELEEHQLRMKLEMKKCRQSILHLREELEATSNVPTKDWSKADDIQKPSLPSMLPRDMLNLDLGKESHYTNSYQAAWKRQDQSPPRSNNMRPGQGNSGYQYAPEDYHDSAYPPMLRQTYSQGPNNMRLDLDPQIYLNLGRSKGKYRRIIDFIPKMSRRNEEEIDLSENVSLMFKDGKKPKLEDVQPAQWVSANSIILAEMIQQDKPDIPLSTLVLDYMSYTVKIGQLANRYTWSSVILYDDEYRDLQFHHQYRWGSDSSHLSTITLVERPERFKRQFNKPTRSEKGSASSLSPSPKFDRPCTYFNEGNCFHKEKCKFPHTCSQCGKGHAAVDCVMSKSGSSQIGSKFPSRGSKVE